MKNFLSILMALLPLALAAQVTSTGNNVSVENPATINSLLNEVRVTGYGHKTDIITTYGKIGLSELLNQYADDTRYTFFEVSEEMFKAFCELEYADSTSIAIFKKIKSVKMLELQRTPEEQEQMESGDNENQIVNSVFYTEITSQLDITGYNQLLKSRNNHSMALFLKKEFGPADNEFLLITDRLVIDIRGDILIKTIYQMEEMMGYVQQILPN